jgi:glycosyltransferase involved in cell wall biosynthesis
MDASLERAAGKLVDAGYRLFRRERYMYFHSEPVAQRFGRVGERKLAEARRPFDILLACGSVDVAYLRTNLPIALILDATQKLVRDYYPAYSHLSARSSRELDSFERAAIQRAALLLFPSQWAARSAVADYQADPAKIHVAPFGADLDSPPPASIVETRQRTDRCRLLFLGTDWRRKGGDIAVETLVKLEEMGVEAELVVCGCVPPPQVTHPRLRVIPYLNKQDERQRKELEDLYLNSDFLLLPTRSDCTPMVFCEAAAFGLPAITSDTGGVTEIVRHGETGFALPLAARGDAYAAVIAETFANVRRYAELVRASRARYEERLNWEAWARAVTPFIQALARQQASMLQQRRFAQRAAGGSAH